MGLKKELAKFVPDTDFDDIPPGVIEKGKHCFLDWLGCTLAGIKDDASRVIIEYVKENSGKQRASVIGAGIKTDIQNAALANGIISHALDFDDYHSDVEGVEEIETEKIEVLETVADIKEIMELADPGNPACQGAEG